MLLSLRKHNGEGRVRKEATYSFDASASYTSSSSTADYPTRFCVAQPGLSPPLPFAAYSAKSAKGLLAPAPKTVIVRFGGGTRDDETFAEGGQENIPHLLKELLPEGTFFTQVVNAGILGHYVAMASILVGAYECFDNFIAQPPPNPTLFEYFRKELRRPSQRRFGYCTEQWLPTHREQQPHRFWA